MNTMSRNFQDQDIRFSNDVQTLILNLRSKCISNVTEEKWKEILHEQDYSNSILEIRNEILTRVFNKIESNFIEKQRVTFVVECAYEAWKKILCLNFYFHDPCNECYLQTSSWTPDQEPEPCRPDSWNRGNISISKHEPHIKSVSTVQTVLSDYQLIKLEDYPHENYFGTSQGNSVKEISHQLLVCEPEQSVDKCSSPNLTYTSPVSSEKEKSDIYVNVLTSDNSEQTADKLFYKKLLKHREYHLPSILNSNINIPSSSKFIQEFEQEQPPKLAFPPLRLAVIASVKRQTLAHLHDRKCTAKMVNFSHDADGQAAG